MGNRAVIALDKVAGTGIYVHWNGGPESVLAYLGAAKELGFRDPTMDNYGMARLIEVVTIFHGGGLSVGVDNVKSLDCDNYDNGLFIIGKGWEIIERHFTKSAVMNYDQLDADDKEKCDGMKAHIIALYKAMEDKRAELAKAEVVA